MPDQNPRPPPSQRWERPLNFPPGYWKQGSWTRQLSGKYRALAVKGDLDSLRVLLAQHPEFLNKRGSHNRTLLWEAVRRGKLTAVQWLVEQGAEVDATGCCNGESYVQLTPYCAAVYYQRAAVADYLATLKSREDIFRAAFLGDQAQVARELDAHPEMLNAEDPHETLYYVPLLAFPIVGGHVGLLEFLLQRGAVVPPYSAQLLYLAARDARREMIDLLVQYGADVRPVDSGIFVSVSDLAIFEYLLQHGASASQPGKNGFPPLIFMVRGDKGEHPEKARLLLDYGADVNAVGPKGRTALHYAASAGYLDVIAILLEHGAVPALKDDRGETPLSLARAAGKPAAAALLTQHGAIS